jgi:hypothetical protein
MSLLLTATMHSSAWITLPISSWSATSTNGVSPCPRIVSIRLWNADFGRIRAVRRIAEAPISLALTTWLSRVMKSFLRSGRSVSSATSASMSSVPPNHFPVTTEMHGAPAAVYSDTISGIVRSPISSTPCASRRLTSMITGRSEASRASMNAPVTLTLPSTRG